jgi:hypothetical protein
MPRNQSLALACCAFLVWIASQASAELTQCCGSSSPFVFTRPDQLFRTDYGELKAVILEEESLLQKRRLAVGMLTMEPLSLFLPHYINGPAVVYVHRGMEHVCGKWELLSCSVCGWPGTLGIFSGSVSSCIWVVCFVWNAFVYYIHHGSLDDLETLKQFVCNACVTFTMEELETICV